MMDMHNKEAAKKVMIRDVFKYLRSGMAVRALFPDKLPVYPLNCHQFPKKEI